MFIPALRFMATTTKSIANGIYYPVSYLGNQVNRISHRYVVTPLRNSFVMKTILWVMYGEQRYVQKDNYALDIRPAVMIKGNETVYALKHQQEFAFWIKNFSNEDSLCTLALKGKEIGNFRLSPKKSYLVQHPGNMIRFKFDGESLNKEACTVTARFSPIKGHNIQNPYTAQRKHESITRVETKREPEEHFSRSTVLDEELPQPNSQQVECFSFDNSLGAQNQIYRAA
eukprot:CAMPEP_0206207476 /NCGR_PEP_ID=MMETSP0166-20121206/15619_1 /ASSEMBLY_ACC=CAM_ASM_000260 /TAXON_ID=95228 /ORGANISM="Vannella robusta, Strain DIVA3 518/3/11/1/6" /LENGTH=227 /DNA_ID=CAMNT_0053628255 /DNA_START=1478 /DNA_END=2157 /DNA_ORIENTATION=-